MSEVLQKGSVGAEVGNWQRFLNESGFRDAGGKPLVLDEIFFGKTFEATCFFQECEKLTVTGKLDLPTRTIAMAQDFVPFVQAKICRILYPQKRTEIAVIVIHTMEHVEKPKAAQDVAAWFAERAAPEFPAPMASAHYCIDDQETWQGVRDTDVAWHAMQANREGIGIEHAGFARQSAEDWKDEYSLALLARSARLSAKLCARHRIPIVKLSPNDLLSDKRGFCGHADVSLAFKTPGGHTDPGPHFPWDFYLDQVRTFFTGRKTA